MGRKGGTTAIGQLGQFGGWPGRIALGLILTMAAAFLSPGGVAQAAPKTPGKRYASAAAVPPLRSPARAATAPGTAAGDPLGTPTKRVKQAEHELTGRRSATTSLTQHADGSRTLRQ